MLVSEVKGNRGGSSGEFPTISDLAVIGNRRTAAIIDRSGTVCWYCPERFDRPSLLSALLDPGKGAWRILLAGSAPAGRRYLGESAALETRLRHPQGVLTVTDWLTFAPPGLFCRRFSPAPAEVVVSLDPWTGYGRCRARLAVAGPAVTIDGRLHLFASHPLMVDERGVHWVLPKDEEGWAVLADHAIAQPVRAELERWHSDTLGRWRELAARTAYDGPFRDEVAASLRVLRLLAYEDTGAIVAAPTAGLPEVVGGKGNYDYRYAWLRDSAMMVRALIRTERDEGEGRAFLGFLAAAREHARRAPTDAVAAIDCRPVPDEENPPLSGWRDSRPVRIGNRAGRQLQLGALGNVLLAADMIFRRNRTREHADAIVAIGDFLAAHWHDPDSGIWEVEKARQFTESKVMAACGLEAIAPHLGAGRAARYRAAAAEIRRFVLGRCLTREGAFATFEGSQGVDVSAVLFPLWGFARPRSPEMVASIRVLERDWEQGGLFRRDDLSPENEHEGTFLAATFWAAQYWSACRERDRARRYLEAGLAHANDLGLFPEEIGEGGEMLGNLPMGIVHASFLNAAADYATLIERPLRGQE